MNVVIGLLGFSTVSLLAAAGKNSQFYFRIKH